MDVLLKSLKWIKGSDLVTGDLRIHRGKIQKIGSSLIAKKKERTISFDNYYLYPGLINGHDHLEMNLYPQIGSPPYQNYTQWAKDVYKPNESPVQEVESIPLKYRLLWGGIKNLISGVTTVIHHNPWHSMLGRADFPVKVLKKYRWAHSLAFDKKISQNFSSRSALPFIIHAAEGIDALAHGEIRQLDEMGVLKKNTVLIHAVGLSKNDVRLIQDTHASVVWCPSSNLFMFGQTADVLELKKGVKIGLGSDSTMTGAPTLLDEMRVAVKTGQVSPHEVFNMVTVAAARIFNIPIRGIEEGEEADLVIVPISKVNYHDNLLAQQAQQLTAVFVKGKFLYGDTALGAELNPKLYRWQFGKSIKGIAFDLAALKRNILRKTNIRHLQGNLLWQIVWGD